MKKIFIILLTSIVAITGCKKAHKAEGDTKSALALQTGDKNRRHPEGMYCGVKKSENETPEQAKLRVAGALPPFILANFFAKADQNQKIVLIDGAITLKDEISVHNECKDEVSKRLDKMGASAEKKKALMADLDLKVTDENGTKKVSAVKILHSCIINPTFEGNDSFPKILMFNRIDVIDQEFMALAIEAFLGSYVDVKFNKENRKKLSAMSDFGSPMANLAIKNMLGVIDRIEILREELGATFIDYAKLRDSKNASGQSLLKTFATLFDVPDDTKLEDIPGKLMANLSFLNYVAGELLDSYYCSDRTVLLILGQEMNVKLPGRRQIMEILNDFAVAIDAQTKARTVGNLGYPWFYDKDKYKNPLDM